MRTAADIMRMTEMYASDDESHSGQASAAASQRTYTRGATGTPTGGQFAKTSGTAKAKPKPAAKPAPKPAAKPAAKAAPKATPLGEAANRSVVGFGTLSEHTPAGDQRVKDLQSLMNGLGMKVGTDGAYGKDMTAAVKALQAKLGIAQTGHVTSGLMGKLQSAAKLSPCIKLTEGVMFSAAQLMTRAREGFNPEQRRAPGGTGIGGRWVSMGAVVAALRGNGHHEAAASIEHMDAPSVPKAPTHHRAAAPRVTRGGDRPRATRLQAHVDRLDKDHAAPLYEGSPMHDPQARTKNRGEAAQLRAALDPIQARIDTEDAILADNARTKADLLPNPDGDHLAAARAHVAAMQGGAPQKHAITMAAADRTPAAPSRPNLVGRQLGGSQLLQLQPGDVIDIPMGRGQAPRRTAVKEVLAEGIVRTVSGATVTRNSDDDVTVVSQVGAAVPAKAAKSAAAKMTRTKTPSEPPEQTRARLDAASSREEARAVLAGMTTAQLKALGAKAAPGGSTRADLIDAIVERTTGSKVNSDAIRSSVTAFGPTDSPMPTAAAKMAGSKVDHASIAAQVQAAGSEDEVEQLLANQKLAVADLKIIAGHVGSHVSTKGSKAQLTKNIAAGGLKNRPAANLAGDWTQGADTALPAPAAIDDVERARRAAIVNSAAASQSDGRPGGMQASQGAGFFSNDPEMRRQAAAGFAEHSWTTGQSEPELIPKASAAKKMARSKAPTHADLVLADEVARIPDGDLGQESGQRTYRAWLATQPSTRVQAAGRVLGVDLTGLDRETAANRLVDHAMTARPAPPTVGKNPVDDFAERASAANTEAEAMAVLQGATNVAQLRKIATATGIRVPASTRSAADIRAFIARSLAAFGS